MNSFLQSQSWGKFQEAIGRKVFSYKTVGISAMVIVIPLRLGKTRMYIPHGPLIDFNKIEGSIKNEISKFIAWVKKIAKENNSILIKVEPLDDKIAEVLISGGFKYSKRTIEHHKTVIIDLNKGVDELLDKMHNKTRYNLRVADKHVIEIEKGNDIDDFWRLLRKTTERDGFSSWEKSYYKTIYDMFGNGSELSVSIWNARHQGEVIASAMIGYYGDTGYYLYGASDYENRAFMAPTALQWRIIRDLKLKGYKYYDMWGIDANKWPGVTRFKLRWGGRVVEYPGAFDLVISRFWNFIYDIARKF